MNTRILGQLGFTLTALSLAALGGCGGSKQDSSTATTAPAYGLVIDGRVAGGIVWADLNNNNKIEAFEPQAVTDEQGFYSYNPTTSTNYCLDNVPSNKTQHCLRLPASSANVIIRVTGGTDISTGEQLKGMMAIRATSLSELATPSATPLVLSPITTLLSEANNAAEETSLRTMLGIDTDDDLRLDYSTASDTKSKTLLANAVTLQTLQDLFTSPVKNASTDSSEALRIAQHETVRAMKTLLASQSSTATVSSAFNTTGLQTVANTVAQQVATLASAENVTTTITSSSELLSSTARTTIARAVGTIQTLVNNETSSEAETKGVLKALEVIQKKIKNNAADATSALDLLEDSDTTRRDALLTALEQPQVSATALSEVNFTTLTDATSVTTATTVSGQAVFNELANKELVLSEYNTQQNKDILAILFFAAEASSDSTTSGTLTGCVRYVDGLKSNGTLKDSGTLGEFINAGTWQTLNEGYTLQVNLTLAGADKRAMIQYGGVENGNHTYRTDFEDNSNGLQSWTGTEAPTDRNAEVPLPTTDAECIDRLNNQRALAVTVNP